MNPNKKQKFNESKPGNQNSASEAKIETVEIEFPSHYPFNDMICRAEHKELFCALFKEGAVKKPKEQSYKDAHIDLRKSIKG